jgi:hypothetical protein
MVTEILFTLVVTISYNTGDRAQGRWEGYSAPNCTHQAIEHIKTAKDLVDTHRSFLLPGYWDAVFRTRKDGQDVHAVSIHVDCRPEIKSTGATWNLTQHF